MNIYDHHHHSVAVAYAHRKNAMLIERALQIHLLRFYLTTAFQTGGRKEVGHHNARDLRVLKTAHFYLEKLIHDFEKWWLSILRDALSRLIIQR